MALAPHDIRDFLEESVTYPVTLEEVRASIGDREIAAPDLKESETIGDLLKDVGVEEFDSADDLTQTIHSMLPDEYIGRKFYDDRSNDVGDPRVKYDEEDQSF